MRAEITYLPANMGDWGIPEASPGGSYGTESLKTADGTELYFRYWQAADPQAPVFVFVHGLGAHTGWFIDLGNQMNGRGLNVYMDDHRAFGRSGGARGHVKRASIYLDDLHQFLAEVQQRHPQAQLFLCGHSMGGIFSINIAAAQAQAGAGTPKEPPLVKGLILINPWIQDSVKVAPATVVRMLVGGLRGSDAIIPRETHTDTMTLVPEATRLLDDDRYWVRNQSGSFLYQMTRMRLQVLRMARKVQIPALVIQTLGDRTLVQKATRQCYLELGSEDKTWKTYADMGHDFEFDPNRSVLDADMADWILRHRGQA
jgi:alpha-beta hydrolase superfamily lysophospholipase